MSLQTLLSLLLLLLLVYTVSSKEGGDGTNNNRLKFQAYKVHIEKELYRIQQDIGKNVTYDSSHDHYDPDVPAVVRLSDGFYSYYAHDKPILIQRMKYNVHTLGNQLGNYFYDVSCAATVGMHFIGTSPTFYDNYGGTDLFWQGLPAIIPHPHPNSYADAIAAINTNCSCRRYCWNANDPWVYQLPLINSIISDAITLHMSMKDDYGIQRRYMYINKQSDITLPILDDDMVLPLQGDVAIHYRCSDNLYGGMGLMAFGYIIKRIPTDAKYIYIFSEYGSRLNGSPMEKASDGILRELMNQIHIARPDSIVVNKRGGHELTIWAQFALSRVLICSPSTFCLWPALARKSGVTYFPSTSYIFHTSRDSSKLEYFKYLPDFHWVFDLPLYNNFTVKTDVKDIIHVLTGDM